MRAGPDGSDYLFDALKASIHDADEEEITDATRKDCKFSLRIRSKGVTDARCLKRDGTDRPWPVYPWPVCSRLPNEDTLPLPIACGPNDQPAPSVVGLMTQALDVSFARTKCSDLVR